MQNIFDNHDTVGFTPELMCTKVFGFLRDAIIQEKIKPGEKLNVAFIASKLGVSRSPVREAIRILEAHNFVETIPQKGAYVKLITTEEIAELYVVLKMVLSTAVGLTTRNLNPTHRQELLSIVQDLQKAKESLEVQQIIASFRRFHNFVVACCGNSLLIKLHDSLFVYRERPFLLSENIEPKDFRTALDENIAISELMLTGAAEQAEQLMRQLMVHAENRTLKALGAREKKSGPHS